MNLKNIQKKVFAFGTALAIGLNLLSFFSASAQQVSCTVSGCAAGTTCDAASGVCVLPEAPIINTNPGTGANPPAGMGPCRSNSSCAVGTVCDIPSGVCVLPEAPIINTNPDTGANPPSGISNFNTPGPNSSWCGGDPNLVYDTNAKICLPKNEQCNPGSIRCVGSLSELVIKIIDYLLIFAGMIAVLFIIIGGFWYITAAGNEEQSEKGKRALLNAIIGIVIVSLAFLLVRIISNTLNSGNI